MTISYGEITQCCAGQQITQKMVRYGRKLGKEDDADIGNFVYAKIEAKSRKTDPFMALAASMTVEDDLPYAQSVSAPDLGVFTY